jgi:hypothetical protein
MSTTWATTREEILATVDDYIEASTSTTIPGAATEVKASALEHYGAGSLAGKYLTILTGNNAGVSRVIQTHTVTGGEGVFDVFGANLAAEAGNVDFFISTIDPTRMLRLFNRAISDCWPKLHKPKSEKIITGNWGPDPLLQDWASTSELTWWVAGANLTVAQESSEVVMSGRGVKLSDEGGGTATQATLYSTGNAKAWRLLQLLEGYQVTIYAHVKADTALGCRLNISDDGGSTWTNGTRSVGTGWEWISCTLEIGDDAKEIQFQIEVMDGVATDVYWDAYKIVGPYATAGYWLPNDIKRERPLQVCTLVGSKDNTPGVRGDRILDYDWQMDDFSGERLLHIPNHSWGEDWLEVLGRAELTKPSSITDTGSVEVEGKQLEYLIAKTLEKIHLSKAWSPAAEDIARFASEAGKWRSEAERMERDISYHVPSQPATRRRR